MEEINLASCAKVCIFAVLITIKYYKYSAMRIRLLVLLLTMTALGLQAQERLFILGGELSNSAVTSVEDIDRVMPRMKALGLNTVLTPAYWEFLEPEEGRFDYTLVDRTVLRARENGLKLVFLWFGAWKNSMSCYAPLWFKKDTKRFPRAQTKDGKRLEIASCFSEEVFQADNRAFGALMRHLSQTAGDVVSMVQVENEIGMLESARDHSPLAERAYDEPIPRKLYKTLGIGKPTTWRQLFGSDPYGEEKFMAYHYARYVGRLCETARRYTQMPLYVNAAMNSRNRQPGQYPSAGPLAHLIDFWKAGAPGLLCLAPDIYDAGFKDWADRYALPGNPLFVPECHCTEDCGARAMYVFGEHHALGFSPFAIDQASPKATENLARAYDLLKQIVNSKLPDSTLSWGLLFSDQRSDKERIIHDEDMRITCRHYNTLPWAPQTPEGSAWPEGGAMLVKLSKSEYLLAGTGVVVRFGSEIATPHSDHRSETVQVGIGSIDEVSIDEEGTMHYLRRNNGDENHQGRHAQIACGDWKILHIKLYTYE